MKSDSKYEIIYVELTCSSKFGQLAHLIRQVAVIDTLSQLLLGLLVILIVNYSESEFTA
jgi:hypothetical protein